VDTLSVEWEPCREKVIGYVSINSNGTEFILWYAVW
jgi:hypothetical protein